MTFEQQKATLEAAGAFHAITAAMNDGIVEISKHDRVDKTPEAMEAFFAGLRSLLNVAHEQLGNAYADMAEALARANPPTPTTTLN